MENTAEQGVRALVHTLLVGSVTNGPFDADNEELHDFLASAAYISTDDLQDISDELTSGPARHTRSRFRYLAALMPDRSLHQLAEALHYVINNDHLSITEVRDVLRGMGREVPLEKIQLVGKLLATGTSLRATAKEAGLSFETVQRIENFLGIAEQRRLQLVDYACDAVRGGWSVRKFAVQAGIPKSTAHVLMRKARSVLVEIGEGVNN
jgi:lambda repressor-like predicted transcriptional regulator